MRSYEHLFTKKIVPSPFGSDFDWYIVIRMLSDMQRANKRISLVHVFFNFIPNVYKCFAVEWFVDLSPINRIDRCIILNYKSIKRTSSGSFTSFYKQRTIRSYFTFTSFKSGINKFFDG